jgi:hypothetical protein
MVMEQFFKPASTINNFGEHDPDLTVVVKNRCCFKLKFGFFGIGSQ